MNFSIKNLGEIKVKINIKISLSEKQVRMGNDNGVLDKNGNYYDYELMPSSFNEFYFELIKDFNEKKKIKVTFYYANNPKKLFKTIQLHY